MNDYVSTEERSFWDRHRFLLLVLISIIIAAVLVVISMMMYLRSGASQLDLSRPGYQGVQSQVERGDDLQNYATTGSVDKESIEEFKKLFKEQADKANAVDAFSGDPLRPATLGISEPAE